MSKVSALVVDDAPFIRDLMKKGLRDNFPGLHIEEAVNGRKAQQLLSRQNVDLILCDWEMPEMSGLELLTWCRAQENLKTTPFIMVTSRGDKENVVQAIQAGVSDYIGKPFSNDQLVAKIKKALSRSGKLEALAAHAPRREIASGMANDSLAALTGGRAEVIKPAASPAKPAPAPRREIASGMAYDSLAALTGGRAEGIKPAASPAKPAPAPKPASAPQASARPAGSGNPLGQAQLRLPQSSMPCVIKAVSLKEAQLVVKRADPLPQVLESAVLDLEENSDVARLNGYLHAIAALEPKPDSDWLLLTLRFVDRDPQKLDYLSRLIARGSTQKHYVPGA
ncbi:chemotaxis response regulator CheY [Pseudomonas aeruginosa]